MITFSKLGHYGQLCNQMFQYALLLGVAAKNGYEIRIPKNYTAMKKKGLVELSKFCITADILSTNDKLTISNTYLEKSYAYDDTVFMQPDGTDFEGYYQCEKYFLHIEDKIRKEFMFDEKLQKYAAMYMGATRKTEKVIALHVRRGDYVKYCERFHVLTPEYYYRALEHFPGNAQIFVFSDDMNWCKQSLKLPSNTVFVKTSSHWQDLCLMTFCDHYIMSGSSFSWWGAWLSQNHAGDRIVIAPKPWFPNRGSRKDYDMSTVVPESWLTQDVYV